MRSRALIVGVIREGQAFTYLFHPDYTEAADLGECLVENVGRLNATIGSLESGALIYLRTEHAARVFAPPFMEFMAEHSESQFEIELFLDCDDTEGTAYLPMVEMGDDTVAETIETTSSIHFDLEVSGRISGIEFEDVATTLPGLGAEAGGVGKTDETEPD